MRGTLSARLIVANASTPSKAPFVSTSFLPRVRTAKEPKPTHSCHNLRLQTELILKSTGKVNNTAFTILCNVRNFPNMVEHVSTCEEEDRNQAESSPKVPVLYNRRNVWRGDGE